MFYILPLADRDKYVVNVLGEDRNNSRNMIYLIMLLESGSAQIDNKHGGLQNG